MSETEVSQNVSKPEDVELITFRDAMQASDISKALLSSGADPNLVKSFERVILSKANLGDIEELRKFIHEVVETQSGTIKNLSESHLILGKNLTKDIHAVREDAKAALSKAERIEPDYHKTQLELAEMRGRLDNTMKVLIPLAITACVSLVLMAFKQFL